MVRGIPSAVGLLHGPSGAAATPRFSQGIPLTEDRPNYGPGEGQWQWMGVPVRRDTCRWGDREWWFAGKDNALAGWGVCEMASTLRNEQSQSLSLALDGSAGFPGELVTDGAFGCVQWERKE
jgi:hypothetical protein